MKQYGQIFRPNRLPRQLAMVVPIAVTALVASACGGGGGASTVGSGGGSGSSSGLQTINVGLVPTTDTAPLYAGIQKGFFAEQGLQVQPTQVDSGGTVLTGVVQGSYDIAFIAAVPAIVAASKGLPLVAIAGNGSINTGSPGNIAIVVKKDSPINSYAGLAGKTVSVNSLGNTLDLCTRAAMSKAGADPSAAKIIELPFSQVAPSLVQGQIDAGALVDPFRTQVLGVGDLRSIGDPCQSLPDKAPVSTYIASKQTVTNKADLMQRFERAVQKSQDFLNNNPGEFAKIVPTFTKITPEVAQKILQNAFSSQIDRNAYLQQNDLMLKQGLISSTEKLQGFVP